MDLELDDDQRVLRDSALAVLERACPPALVRRVHEDRANSKDRGADSAAEGVRELWQTLVGLDWPALGMPAEHGGLGGGFVEVGVLIEALGTHVAPGPYLSTATQFSPALSAAGSGACLAQVAAGELTGTVAIAERGRWSPRIPATVAEPDGSGDWVLSGTKSHVLDGATADEMVVVARGGRGPGVFLVPAAAVRAEPLSVIDPTLGLATVHLDRARVAPERVLVEPGDPRAGQIIERTLDVATAALALSTVATCRRIFDTTLEYVKLREQFGRPIGSFQAVKHRLADCYLAVERADALAWFAVATVAEHDDRLPVAASMAKCAAGDCQRLLTRDGLQLHGGIGYTWENDLHFWLKRAATGELLFGTSAAHRARLGRLLDLEAPVTGGAVA